MTFISKFCLQILYAFYHKCKCGCVYLNARFIFLIELIYKSIGDVHVTIFEQNLEKLGHLLTLFCTSPPYHLGCLSLDTSEQTCKFVNCKFCTNCTKVMYFYMIFVWWNINLIWSDFTRWNHAWPDPALFQMQSVHKESTEYNITPFTDSKCLCKKPQTAQVFSLVATKHPSSLATEW